MDKPLVYRRGDDGVWCWSCPFSDRHGLSANSEPLSYWCPTCGEDYDLPAKPGRHEQERRARDVRPRAASGGRRDHGHHGRRQR